MLIKLTPGRRLRDPVTNHLVDPDAVFEVSDHDRFWLRRLRDGDVAISTASAKAAPPADKPPAA